MKQLLIVSWIGFCTSIAWASDTAKVAAADWQDEIKYTVNFDLQRFRETHLGQQILDMARKEMANAVEGGSEETIAEALGFDPLLETQRIIVMGSTFDDPVEDLCIVMVLGNTAGNVEGLVLAAPGYQSSEHGDYVIHEVHEDEMEAFAAVHSGRSKSIVAAGKRERLIEVLDWMDNGGRLAEKRPENGAFIQVSVNELPMSEFPDGPPANIAKMIRSIDLMLIPKNEDFQVKLRAESKDEQTAKQLQQLVQGAVALVGLAKEEIGEQEGEMLVRVAESLDASSEGSTIEVNLTISQEVVTELLENNDIDFDLDF